MLVVSDWKEAKAVFPINVAKGLEKILPPDCRSTFGFARIFCKNFYFLTVMFSELLAFPLRFFPR